MNTGERLALMDNTVEINGQEYYSVAVFAELTDRSEQSIRLLIHKGNRFRQLEALKLGEQLFVKQEELVDFPFSCAGRSKMVIRYNEFGEEYSEYVH